MSNSPDTALIHILDDDSLLNVFHLYRPFLLGEDEDDDNRLLGGLGRWVREHWWCRLAHVCQRWRNVILGSASYLSVSLLCTNGTRVADMLAHSIPLPLVIDYSDKYHDITAEDEEGMVLALKQRDRVRRVRLRIPLTNLQKLVVAMDEEYPILEYLVIMHWIEDNTTIMIFPETFQAPHLRHLVLVGFTLPLRSRLLTTAVGLVTLGLFMDHPSTYFHPNTLFQWLSLMPQLETLVIDFLFPVPSRNVTRQLMHMPIMTTITLPNLHHFRFRGVSTYMEALVHRITTPRPKKLDIYFFNQLTFSVPRIQQFMNTPESLAFKSVKFEFFDERVDVDVYQRGEGEMYALSIRVFCRHLDWQVSSTAQISNSLGQMFSTVERLTLEHRVHNSSSEVHNEVDRIEWRNLLRSFTNVKNLRIDNVPVEQLSHCLQLEDGEGPLELLPELQELTYSGSSDAGNAFTSFLDTRQDADRPVVLVLP